MAQAQANQQSKVLVIVRGGVAEVYAEPGTDVCLVDYYCNSCAHDFKLKSKKGRRGGKIVDGAFLTMTARIDDGTQPNLLLLAYESQLLRAKSGADPTSILG
ncbi:MAG: hypothetical protein H0W93_04920 [Gammaproteobacteria bacterium]|nr:hypothetical protein [Gammaproteobacteria bacterium]